MLGGLVPLPHPELFSTPIVIAMMSIGVLVVVLGRKLKQDVDVRCALVAASVVTLIGLWPVLLVLPATVLQYRSSSNAWFTTQG